MDITLNEQELDEAVSCYLTMKGFDTSNSIVETKVVQGRNGNGTRVEISVESSTSKKPKAAVAEPKAENDDLPFDIEADAEDVKEAEPEVSADEDDDDIPVAKSEVVGQISPDKPAFGKLFPNSKAS
jgi:hypothetical protein